MGDIVNLDDVIRKEMERNNVTKPGEMVLNPVNREEPSNSLMTVATAMRTAIRYSTAAIPMSSMYGAFTSAQEIRSRKCTPYSHPCTSKESTFRTSTAERRRMLTQHFRQKSKRQTMHSASAHGNWQNAFRIPQRIWLQQKSS